MNELALFAGAGGGILGGKLLGWRTVCAVEWEPYPASVLCARQNDGVLSPFPVWNDVQTFDGKPWRGIVDVVSGGFPCQDISAAGKGAGIDGARSGMWREMARIIHEVRPRYAFVENSPMLTSRGLGTVLGDLAAMGFDARWGVLGAADVGANHQRDRIWIVAKWRGQLSYAQHDRIRRWEQQQESTEKTSRELANAGCELRETWDTAKLDAEACVRSSSTVHDQSSCNGQEYMADTTQLFSNGRNDNSRICLERETKSKFRDGSWPENVTKTDLSQQQGRCLPIGIQQKDAYACDSRWWQTEPNVGRMANGVAAGMDRLKAIGNGQVPLCAATAWRILSETL